MCVQRSVLLLEMCSIEMHLPKDMHENVPRNPIFNSPKLDVPFEK